MRTKAFHAFESKLLYFNDDIELVDVLKNSVEADDLLKSNANTVFKYVDKDRHKYLARRKNSDGSRKLLVLHLRSTLYSSYIKDIYEEVTHYLKTILEQAAENGLNAGRIIGDHTFKIDAKYVLKAGNWESVAQLIADSIFQALESERSTIQLLEKIAKKLALDMDENHFQRALPFLEVRHLLVHADGKASEDFIHKYPAIKRNKKNYITLSYEFVCEARDAIQNLVSEYDKEIILKNIINEKYLQP